MDSFRDLTLEFEDPQLADPVRMSRKWQGFGVELTTVDGTEPYRYSWSGNTHYLALHDIMLADGETCLDGLKPLHMRDLRDTITFLPSGYSIEGWSSPAARQNSFTALFFDPDRLRDEIAEIYRSALPALGPVLYARDGVLHATMQKLAAVITNPHINDIYAESACILAAVEALSLKPPVAAGKLTHKQLSAVIDYINEHMEADIGLSELAAAAGLTRYHFGRAFKATTGESPYAFLQARRVDKAAEFLASGDLLIDEIAIRTGFRNPAALRRHFQQSGRSTPRSFRRDQS